MNKYLLDKLNLKQYQYLVQSYADDKAEEHSEKVNAEYRHLMAKYELNHQIESRNNFNKHSNQMFNKKIQDLIK